MKKVQELFSVEDASAASWLFKAGESGEFALTEVTLDYRKYKSDEEADRFAAQLWDSVDVALGVRSKLNTNLPKIDKDGRTLNTTAINNLLTSLGGETLIAALDKYPILSTIMGDLSKKPMHIGRLAREISLGGVGHYLNVLSGHVADRMLFPILESSSREESKPFEIGLGKPWGITYSGENPWMYIAHRANWSALNEEDFSNLRDNALVNLIPSKGYTRLRVGPTLMTIDPIRFVVNKPKEDGTDLGFVDVYYINTVKRARLILRSNNAMYGSNPDLMGVSLVSILDILGERLARSAWKANRKLESGEYSEKGHKEEVRKLLEDTINEFARLPGESHEGRVNREAALDSVEASVILPRGLTPKGTMRLTERLLGAISRLTFTNPLDANISHAFYAGMTSKNKPGTIVSMLPMEPVKFPLLRYLANGWIDSERQIRESRSVRFAYVPSSEQKLAFTNGLEDKLGGMITRRRRDAVWVSVSGLGWMFSDKAYNGDMGRITPYGMSEVYKRTRRPEITKPMSEKILMLKLKELGFDSIDEAQAEGIEITTTNRRCGLWNKRVMFENMYTLTIPAHGSPSWHKIYICGHKFVAVPTEKDYFVQIGSELVPVAGFVPIESMLTKKLHGSIVCAQNVLLGEDYIVPDSVIIHPDRKEGDDPTKYDDMTKEVYNKLVDRGLDTSGHFPLICEGQNVGLGVPGIYPTFMLREDDKISSGASAHGFPRNLIMTRMLGERINISKRDAGELFAFSRFISGEDPLGYEELLTLCDMLMLGYNAGLHKGGNE